MSVERSDAHILNQVVCDLEDKTEKKKSTKNTILALNVKLANKVCKTVFWKTTERTDFISLLTQLVIKFSIRPFTALTLCMAFWVQQTKDKDLCLQTTHTHNRVLFGSEVSEEKYF